MAIQSFNAQQRFLKASSEAKNGKDSGFLNSWHVRCELPLLFAKVFASVKEYFWPTPDSVLADASQALVDRSFTVNVENTLNPNFREVNRYHSIIKRVAIVATTTGLAMVTYLVHSALFAHGNMSKQGFSSPDALSVTLATTVFIGRRLLAGPIVANTIANQSVFPNTPFNLKIDLNQMFSYTEVADVRFLQMDDTALPNWLTMSITPTLVGSMATLNAYKVTIVGNYAYVADQGGGLKIIDISNKTDPTIIGNIMNLGVVQRVAVVGNYAYVTDYLNGLKIVDISNKASPALIGSIKTMVAYDVAVVDNYAYVADQGDGLKIIDISNKTSPTLIGSVKTQNAYGIFVDDNYAYIADWGGGLKIIDINNKTNPYIIGSTAIQEGALGITVVDNYAYVAGLCGGLIIIDVSNIRKPTLLGSISTSQAYDVAVVGNYAYVADINSGLEIIDISNKTKPILAGSAAMTSVRSLTVFDNYVYVANSASGLKIFSVNNISLSGTPALLDRGTMPIKLTITDTLGDTASIPFWITVLNHPPIAPSIESQTVHHLFSWIIPEFTDNDGDLLSYSATLTDGSPLPDWISFNSATRNLSGAVPPVVTVRKVNIQADDSYGGIANAIQTIDITNLAPHAGLAELPSQNIHPLVPFNVSIDSDLFVDPEEDPLTYSVALENQQPLPTWLTYDQKNKIITGIPSEYYSGSMSVIISAADPFGAMAMRSFNLLSDVTPNRNRDELTPIANNQSINNLVIKIVGSIGATFAIMGASYAVAKKSIRYVNRLPTEFIIFGQASDYCHTVTRIHPEKLVSVRLLRDGKSLPAGVLLPDWIIYDNSSAKLTIDAKALKQQDGLISSRWTVQIKNKGGCVNRFIWEEFDIKFNLNDDEQDISDSIAMKQPRSRQEQLLQPLISV